MSELRSVFKEMGALVICQHDFKRSGLTFSVVFPPNMVSEGARRLLEAGYFLEDVSVFQVKEGFVATYHYDSAREPGRVAIRALAPDGVFVSITSVYQGAEWHERESTDFFGVTFIGNTNPVPLLLAHDFPDPPPLCKAEADLSSISALGLFGEPEILDKAWEILVLGPKSNPEEGAV